MKAEREVNITSLVKRIEELERRVSELEKRPALAEPVSLMEMIFGRQR
jgi:hypothetical protein